MEFSEPYNIEEQFLTNFLRLIEDYGSCSGLEINHDKSEILFLGNRAYILQESNVVPDNIHNIKVKKSVNFLGTCNVVTQFGAEF